MELLIRRINKNDSEQVRQIIKTVMPEFGASGEGFAIHDAEVENMFEAYAGQRAAYFVLEQNKIVIGGGGIAPLEGGDEDTCELKKMYFLPEARGQGMGKRVLMKCLEEAKTLNFTYCYLETFHTMKQAMKLYEHMGFKKISGPKGSTGHFGCNTFYQIEL